MDYREIARRIFPEETKAALTKKGRACEQGLNEFYGYVSRIYRVVSFLAKHAELAGNKKLSQELLGF